MKLTRKNIDDIIPSSKVLQFRDHVVSDLYLIVHPTGKKTWYLESSAQEKENVVYIGKYPKIDLRAARKIAQIQLQGIYTNIVSTPSSHGNSHLIDEQKRVKLAQIVRGRETVKFKPNPLFNDLKNTNKNVSDLRLKEEKKRRLYLRRQGEIEIAFAWEKYQQTKNLAILSNLLRSESLINNALPTEMALEIAYFLDQAATKSQCVKEVDDDRIFMTYWRYTEFENGVEPLLMDLEAVGECVTFMEAIGRSISFENIKRRIESGYALWREDNAEKLEKSAKVIREMKNQPAHSGELKDELDV